MRTVVVLAEAAEDIEQARDFYDAQEPGIGDYCAGSLVADIESLASITESIPAVSDFTGCSPIGFPSGFITARPRPKRKSLPCWICAEIRIGFAGNFRGAVSDSFAVIIQRFSVNSRTSTASIPAARMAVRPSSVSS